MGKSTQRRCEALEYSSKPAILTAKQYLVYTYLLSVSKWNSAENEKHYYVYKNSFVMKDVCQLLGITPPTWRSSIKKLHECGLIIEGQEKEHKQYKISIPKNYASLELSLIKFLLPYATVLNPIGGGNIISVYSLIYRYWIECKKCEESCEITVNQIRAMFTARTTKENFALYKAMLNIFKATGLIEYSECMRTHNGLQYRSYIIKKVNNSIENDDIVFDKNSISDVTDIISKIGDIDNIIITE